MSSDLLVDLASEPAGGRVLAASDELLGPKEDLLRESGPGWETRRRRTPGHDWAIIVLGLPGFIRHFVVDTTGFAGRRPSHASVESIYLPGSPDIVELVRDPGRWTEIVPRTPIATDGENLFAVESAAPATHLRLVVYPDGGVAGLQVLGEPTPPQGLLDGGSEIDLAALSSGARTIDCSGAYFSSPNDMLGQGAGWLTHRRRSPGHEWAIIRLAGRGAVNRLEIDTTGLAGNVPEAIEVATIDAPGASPKALNKADWQPMLRSTQVQADKVVDHTDLLTAAMTTHLRVALHPDGGLARFRAFGASEEPWTSQS